MLSRESSKRLSFSADLNDEPATLLKEFGGMRAAASGRTRVYGVRSFGLPRDSKFSAVRCLRHLGAKVARALRLESLRRRSSRKVSSSSLPRSRSLAESIDSHRAEAIEECIEFLNSSSSLHRSNSVSASSC